MTNPTPLPNIAMPQGWQCPVCGTVYAPWVWRCEHALTRPACLAWLTRRYRVWRRGLRRLRREVARYPATPMRQEPR